MRRRRIDDNRDGRFHQLGRSANLYANVVPIIVVDEVGVLCGFRMGNRTKGINHHYRIYKDSLGKV